MPARKLPQIGEMFGSWTFLGEFNGRKWRCACVCGAIHWPNSCHLRSGHSSSCRSCSNLIHGGAGTKLYALWCGIKTRCYTVNYDGYSGYGGRGIKVCDEWLRDFQAFADYVGKPPSEKHTLDRKNNSGNYEPGNVRWSLPKVQARNRRDNHWITIENTTLCATDWCLQAGISLSAAHNRVKKMGWSWEKAVTTPPITR